MPPMSRFGPASRAWFERAFGAPTPVQAAGWEAISRGEHALLLAPTGSGKTLAAFFYAIDQLARHPRGADALPGVRVLYISPLKALVTDIERNLRAPLAGIERAQERLGEAVTSITVGIRTGDTPADARRQMVSRPPDILVTTPESLFLLLTSKASETLKTVNTVIVDEIHALAPSKRGAHLALSLERLEALCTQPLQRIGLSATVRPHEEAARFLAGARPVNVVDKSARPKLQLTVEVPCDDMLRPPPPPASGPFSGAVNEGGNVLGELARAEAPLTPAGRDMQGMWAVITPRIAELLQSHRSTIVFVGNRSLCERLAQSLNALCGDELVRAHHGSVSRQQRHDMEEALKAGTLRGIIATSSLELGIDMGSIDLVVLVESPGSVARGLQRVGRAGHGVGQKSVGICLPKHPGDLLETAAIVQRMHHAELEPIFVVHNALDVLAQHLVAHCGRGPCEVGALEEMVRRAYPFSRLTRDAFISVLDMLSGTYPSDEFAELRPLLNWDRSKDVVVGRKSAQLTAVLNAGTIVDRGNFGVFLAGEGPRVGELDEEMVHESRKGDIFILGASSWRIEEITRDQVRVSPAPGQPGKMPFWRGEGPGRPVPLGRAVGALCRTTMELVGAPARNPSEASAGEAAALAELHSACACDERAAKNLLRYLREQQQANGCVPSDRAITVEWFRDEVGDWRVCILSPFGAQVHAPWAMLIEARLREEIGQPVDALYTNDGIALRISQGAGHDPEGGAASGVPLTAERLIPDADGIEEDLTRVLGHTALFASHFRENATRSLLLARQRARGRAPLWQQRLRAKTLLTAAERYPRFPIVLETYRQLLSDVFDLPALAELLRQIERREICIDVVVRDKPSPFARSLAFAYVQTYLYEQDAPSAERRAQALTLDTELLRELMGEQDLRSLLDAAVVDEVEAQLQARVAPLGARDADGIGDMLRRLGDLSLADCAERLEAGHLSLEGSEDVEPGRAAAFFRSASELLGAEALAAQAAQFLDDLVAQRRAVPLRIAGATRYVAVEDVARYRDGLGVVPPGGLPTRFLGAAQAPLEGLVQRYARTHGPFSADSVATRFGLSPAQAAALLDGLVVQHGYARGAIDPRPGAPARSYCHPEVVRRLKRATLQKLRRQIAALEPRAYARFLPGWQGLETPQRGTDGVEQAVRQLAGLPLSFQAWCDDVLPARIRDFSPDLLDVLCATGVLVWVGAGALGSRDGRIRLYARDQVASLLERPAPFEPPSPLHEAIVGSLQRRGPSFMVNLQQATGARVPALEKALWDLVWAGQITNDTVQPLRQLVRPPTRRGAAAPRGIGGRWSTVSDLFVGDPDPTAQAHARAQHLLHRYGLVAREHAVSEAVPGGFTALYAVYKAMEEAGRVRRGLFVERLGAAQFALPAAVERLRAGHEAAQDREPVGRWLSAIDPAQPYGGELTWPPLMEAAAKRRLRRVAHAKVWLVEGEPHAYLEANGEHLWLFAASMDHDERWVEGLRALAKTKPARSVVLKQIDGQASLRHPRAAQWLAAGMHARFDGVAVGVSAALTG